jgi:hypothetical protein
MGVRCTQRCNTQASQQHRRQHHHRCYHGQPCAPGLSRQAAAQLLFYLLFHCCPRLLHHNRTGAQHGPCEQSCIAAICVHRWMLAQSPSLIRECWDCRRRCLGAGPACRPAMLSSMKLMRPLLPRRDLAKAAPLPAAGGSEGTFNPCPANDGRGTSAGGDDKHNCRLVHGAVT